MGARVSARNLKRCGRAARTPNRLGAGSCANSSLIHNPREDTLTSKKYMHTQNYDAIVVGSGISGRPASVGGRGRRVFPLPRAVNLALCFGIGVVALALAASAASAAPPKIEARKKPTLTVDGKTFRDLNASGALDPYEDWRLPFEARVSDLIARLTVEEKAGLMLHAAVQGFTGPNGIVLDQGVAMAGRGVATPTPPSAKELVVDRHIRWLLLRATVPAELAARAANAVQELAESTRLGVPVVLSSDPRHTPAPGTALLAFSAWPEQIGFAAIGDPAVAHEFGRIANREYRAIGLRVVLGPMADVATEPRWARIPGTFGEDAALVAQLTRAYIEGFQGETLGPDSVLCVTKHWPGHGPVQDGLDPHLDYGRWQVYPGNNFEHHLGPFRAAFDAGTGGIMPGYAIPVGLDTVGMNFSPVIVRDLLRGKFHFDGLVLTDWLKSMPWGVEKFSQKDRHRLIVEAGCDQIGGEDDPQHLVALMHEGALPASRIDASLRRILRPMFQLGLFENPYVDPAAAKSIAASAEFVRAGLRAQTQSVILLKNAAGLLPLAPNAKIYVENIDRTVAASYGLVVADLAAADVALIKVAAPFALHRYPEGQKAEGFIAELFSKRLHEGTLAYAGAENTGELAAIERLVASGKPVVVCMYLDRPAILTEFLDEVGAVLVHFSSSDRALLDVAFGRAAPSGKLPFDLPRDMDSVRAQRSDVPHDLANPLFRSGFGLSYPARKP